MDFWHDDTIFRVEFLKQLRRDVRELRDAEDVILVNCLGFSDPCHIGHIGENIFIIEKMQTTEGFPLAMRKLKKDIKWFESVHEDTLTPLHIVFFCRSGKHRSVGFARCASHVLQPFMSVKDVRHIARRGWQKHICTDCYHCGPSQRKSRALAYAAEVYSEV